MKTQVKSQQIAVRIDDEIADMIASLMSSYQDPGGEPLTMAAVVRRAIRTAYNYDVQQGGAYDGRQNDHHD